MPRGITRQDVYGAADTLLARGERPTIERVRQEIGRGSPNTVNPLLDAWWQSLSARLRGENQIEGEIPAALLEAVQGLFEQLRQAAVAQADAHLAERRNQLQAHSEELSNREARLEAERSGIIHSLETLQSELNSQREANKILIAAEAELREMIARAQSDSQHLTELLSKGADDRERLRKAHSKELAQAHETAEKQENRWLLEIDRLRQDLKQQRKSTDESLRAAGRLQARLDKCQTAEAAQRRKVQSLEKALSREREARIRAEAKTVSEEKLIRSLQMKSRSQNRLRTSASRQRPASATEKKRKVPNTTRKRSTRKQSTARSKDMT